MWYYQGKVKIVLRYASIIKRITYCGERELFVPEHWVSFVSKVLWQGYVTAELEVFVDEVFVRGHCGKGFGILAQLQTKPVVFLDGERKLRLFGALKRNTILWLHKWIFCELGKKITQWQVKLSKKANNAINFNLENNYPYSSEASGKI